MAMAGTGGAVKERGAMPTLLNDANRLALMGFGPSGGAAVLEWRIWGSIDVLSAIW
jgi:hypothetical protein